MEGKSEEKKTKDKLAESLSDKPPVVPDSDPPPIVQPPPVANQPHAVPQNPLQPVTKSDGDIIPGTNHSQLMDESNSEMLGKIFADLSSSMRAMNSRTLPSWDVNSKHQTIKSHIKLAESMSKRYGWTSAELASELFLSLRGEARSIAESFPSATQQDFKKLEKELLKYFHTAKPQSQILNEFNNYKWKPSKQSIPQYTAILRNKIIKMNNAGSLSHDSNTWDAANEAWLRSRILQGIKEVRPEFGATLELMDVDSKSCSELANFAQQKYDIYRLNNDIRDEHFAALVSTDSNEKTERKNTYGGDQNRKSRRDSYRADTHRTSQRREDENFNGERKQWSQYDDKRHSHWRNNRGAMKPSNYAPNFINRNYRQRPQMHQNFQWQQTYQPWGYFSNDQVPGHQYRRYRDNKPLYQPIFPEYNNEPNNFENYNPRVSPHGFSTAYKQGDREKRWQRNENRRPEGMFHKDSGRNEFKQVRFQNDGPPRRESKFTHFRNNPGTIIKRNDRVDYLKTNEEKESNQKN